MEAVPAYQQKPVSVSYVGNALSVLLTFSSCSVTCSHPPQGDARHSPRRAAIDARLTGDAAAALALPMADELMRVIG